MRVSIAFLALGLALVPLSARSSPPPDRLDIEGKAARSASAAAAPDNCSPPQGVGAHYPAFDPDPPYDVTHYEIRFQIAPSIKYLAGTTTIDAVALHDNLGQVTLDYCGPAVVAVRVNNQPVAINWAFGLLTVSLSPAVTQGDTFHVSVDYQGTMSGNNGIYFPGGSDFPPFDATYSFAEPEDAREWFPCHDVPNDKATLDLIATVPQDLVVGSNGVLVEESYNELGRRVFHWRETHPIATYLISFAAGHYTVLHDNRLPGTPILNFVAPPDSAQAVAAFDKVPEMIEHFSSLFGPYDFDKYGHTVATFPGGMEHQSLTLITRGAITGDDNNSLVAHELGHQWFGDTMTPRDWKNIWLNEGFASYCAALWLEHLRGRNGLNDQMTIYSDVFKLGYIDHNIQSTVYDPPAPNLFGFTVYDKGAWVLHTLRRVMGDSLFFETLRQYHAAHRLSNVVTADFIAAAEAVYGGDLHWYFDPWLNGIGLPRFAYRWGQTPTGDGGSNVTVVLRQKQASPFYPLPIDLGIVVPGIDSTGADTVRQSFFMDQNPDTFHVAVPDTLPENALILVDVDNWILKTVDFEGGLTPVALLEFSAARTVDGVSVRWRVGEEARRNRYRLHRSLPGGPRDEVPGGPFTGLEDYRVIDTSPPAGDVDYWIEAIEVNGTSSFYGPLHLSAVAKPLALAAPHPNPSRGPTTLAYTLSVVTPVRLSIHDVAGRLVAVLVDKEQAAGAYEVSWDGRDALGRETPPGVYYVKLDAGPSGTRSGRIVRIR